MKNILNIEREIHLYQDLYHEHVTIYLELQIRQNHSGLDGYELGHGLAHGHGQKSRTRSRIRTKFSTQARI